MKSMSGTDIALIPYKGVAEAMTDLHRGAHRHVLRRTQIARRR
jgi:tripartite-type tricarboxylate transporter receptor subunit TctC